MFEPAYFLELSGLTIPEEAPSSTAPLDPRIFVTPSANEGRSRSIFCWVEGATGPVGVAVWFAAGTRWLKAGTTSVVENLPSQGIVVPAEARVTVQMTTGAAAGRLGCGFRFPAPGDQNAGSAGVAAIASVADQGAAGAVPWPVAVIALPPNVAREDGGKLETIGAKLGGGLPADLGTGGGMRAELVAELPAGTQTVGKVDQGTGGASAWKVDGSATTQPISAASLPLPANAAAEMGGHLETIDGKIPPQGQAVAGSSMPVVLPASQAAGPLATSVKQDAQQSRLDLLATEATLVQTKAAGEATRDRLPTSLDGGRLAVASTGSPSVTLGGWPSGSIGPFGDLLAWSLTPVAQRAFDIPAPFVAQLDSTAASGVGAAVDIDANRLRVQSGTATNGSAAYTSVASAAYAAGQGNVVRFTAAFPAAAASSFQIVGGLAYSGSDGLFVGRNGVDFGLLHLNGGVSAWTPMPSFSEYVGDGSALRDGRPGFVFDPTKLNVFYLVVPYLGAGNMQMLVEHPDAMRPVEMHTVRYANRSLAVEFFDPTLRFHARAYNAGATSLQTIYVGSYGLFLCGPRAFNGARASFSASKSVTTRAAILSIRNATSINGGANNRDLRVVDLSISSDGGNSQWVLDALLGTTLGGSPSFQPYLGSTVDNGVTLTAAQSSASADAAATTVTGSAVWSTTGARNSGRDIDVARANLIVRPGQTLTFAASSAGAASTLTVAANLVSE